MPMPPHSLLLLVAMLLMLMTGAQARAADTPPARVALVIGNQHYQAEHALANATGDARLMARTLATLGFAVTERYDLSRAQFAGAVSEFAESVPRGATALVYYAGHGMQIAGSNYLNPVDMQVTSEQGTPLRAYPLRNLLEQMSRSKSAVNIIVLDACRNNPFRPRGDVRYRSFLDLGLSRVETPKGTLIAYSTAPGQLAADGAGSNSLYTETLSRALLEPGYEIEQIFKKTGNEVRRKTLDDQIPWYESSLAGKIFFKPGTEATPTSASRPAAERVPDARGQPLFRGNEAKSVNAEQWYRQMGAYEWSRVDWEIQQRVKRLTLDEVPGLKHRAGAGNLMAQTVLGLAFREGLEKASSLAEGMRPGQTMRYKANNTEAWRWLKKAAEDGFPVAQAEVGEMYYAGHGTDRDLQQSRYWLEQAAKANYPRAKLDLLQLGLEANPSQVDFRDAMQSIMESMKVLPATPSSR